MNKLLVICVTLVLVSCASKENAQYVAPSVVAVKTSLERLKSHVTTPQGDAAIKDLSVAVDAYEAQVNQQSTVLAKAQADATYWQNKHSKALQQLWFWRGLAALTLASLAGWLALRMGFKFAL